MMSSSQSPQLDLFPNEVLQFILENATPQTALALERVSRRFREVANEPLLWRTYCLSTFEYWSENHRIEERIQSKESVDWKHLFIERSNLDRKTLETLDSIISSQTNRNAHFQSIIETGDDAKAALLKELHVDPEADDFLARRYWSHATLSSLSRNAALQTWSTLKLDPQADHKLEEALGAFSLFVRGSNARGLSSVTRRLDEMAETIREEQPEIMNLTPRQRAVAVAEYLLRHRYVGITLGREYHSLPHNFMGIAISSEDHSSLPLISVAIYCALCTRFDLYAAPCSFPYHVHAVVYPPRGSNLDAEPSFKHPEEPMFMDPWRSSEEVPISSLRQQLSMIPGIDAAEPASAFLAPASPLEITIRCARNILNSIQQSNPRDLMTRHSDISHRIDVPSARYAALWASVLLSTPSSGHGLPGFFPGGNGIPNPNFLHLHHELLTLLHLFANQFPHDVYLIEKYLMPLVQNLPGNYLNYLSSIRNLRHQDAMPRKQKRRSKYPPGHIKYRVGQVFSHRRYHYQAVITGWDAKCDAREEWIETMQVDSLPGGREQCFYNALNLDDLSTRYVASENIMALKPPETDDFFPFPDRRPPEEVQTGDFALEVGQFFKRWDVKRGMFVNGMEEEYPED